MILNWRYKEIYLTALFFATSKRFTEDDFGEDGGPKDCSFNALMQFCLLNALTWVLLILLQVTNKELFYYNRDITTVVFETRSSTEDFNVVPQRNKDSFTQTEARVLKYDVKRQEGVYKCRERRLRRRFRCLRMQLARSYNELSRRVDDNRQSLSEGKKKLASLVKIRDSLQARSGILAEKLKNEVMEHTNIKARYENCLETLSGSMEFVGETDDLVGAGDFICQAKFPVITEMSQAETQLPDETEEWA